MEGKHTPGPWCLVQVGDDVKKCVVASKNESLLTVVEENVMGAGVLKFGAVFKNADARLMAAAPDLLEALELAVLALNCCRRSKVGNTDSYKIAAQLSAAIAKARGES